MLAKIYSDHPNFLSILRKNPESFGGLQLKQIKNGTGIGFIASPSEYHLVFQDTKYSFSEKDDKNQIDFLSFCHPRVFLVLLAEMLREPLMEKSKWFGEKIPWLDNKTVEDLDVPGYHHKLIVDNIYVDSFSGDKTFVFSKYFPEVKLTHKSGCLFRLEIETQESLHRLINLAALTCMYLTVTNSQNWYLSNDLIRKYIRIMKNLEPVPYFIIYLFTKRCIKNREDFDILKPELNSAFDGDLDLTWGNTQEMRLRAVADHLFIDTKIPYHILEVGCGEMDYARRFLGKLSSGLTWTATDLVDYGHLVPVLNRKHKTQALSFIQSPNEITVPSKQLCLLLIEVIEHLPLEESKQLVRRLLDQHQPDKVIITTPNVCFNRHFGLDREFRHDDHHFELTPQQFADYLSEVLKESHYYADFFGIGDKVDGDYLSLGAELKRIDHV